MTTSIWIRFTAPGFHHWPHPSEHRYYLGSTHRHLFHVTVRVPVTHDDRDIEFHDLMDVCRNYWPANGEWGGKSCEMIAEHFAGMLFAAYEGLPWVEVDISEDGEAGATIRRER